MAHKDSNIFGVESLKRGYDLGRRTAKIFEDCMMAGHSLDTFVDLFETDAKESERWGLISPIGEVVGLVCSPKKIIVGIYYGIKNKVHKNFY